MGTIVPRKRQDGTTGYTAQIRMKRKGEIVHNETRTFDQRKLAVAWLARREDELNAPGGLEKAKAVDPTLSAVIQRYLDTSQKAIGRTKAQVLRTVQGMAIGALPCSTITTQHWREMAEEIDAQPSTRQNYLSHLGAVARTAKPLWGYNLDPAVLREASTALRHHGVIGKSLKRSRRPTVAELDALMAHFAERQLRVPRANPMPQIVAFALYSARRMDEVLRVRWADLDEAHSRVLVHDMKNPGQKIGNDVWCDLPPEALRVVLAMPRTAERIFPFGNDAVGMAFTRAMPLLGIDDLHFHDLRHEGVSRLFEMGMTIPQVAAVSGHRSWVSLQRYAHLRQTGDKWAGWAWLDRVAPITPAKDPPSARRAVPGAPGHGDAAGGRVSGGRRQESSMDVPVTIVSTDEAEQADAVVCLLATEDPGVFRDNITGACHDCGKPVVFRPTAPKAPIKICMRCAVERGRGWAA